MATSAEEMVTDLPKPEDLFEAAEKGDTSIFEALPEEELRRARTLRNEDDRSLLHVAAASGHSKVRDLISRRLLRLLFFFADVCVSLEIGSWSVCLRMRTLH